MEKPRVYHGEWSTFTVIHPRLFHIFSFFPDQQRVISFIAAKPNLPLVSINIKWTKEIPNMYNTRRYGTLRGQDRHGSADLQKSAATSFCSAEAKISAADGSICRLQFIVSCIGCVHTTRPLASSRAIILCTDLGNASKDYLQGCYCPADLIKKI